MAGVIIPPWLEAPDTAGEFLKGASIGASIGAEKARLQAEEQRGALEAQVRQAQIQRTATLQAQQLATQRAYHAAEIGLRSQQLDEAAKVNAFKMQNAADQMSQERGFNAAIGSGMSVEDAMVKFPRANPNNVIAARKSDADVAGASLALRQQAFTEKQQQDAAKRGLTMTQTRAPGAKEDTISWKGTPEQFREEQGREEQINRRQAGIFGPGNVKPAPNAAPPPATTAPAYRSKDDVVAAYKAGKLSRAEAKKVLTEQFDVKE